MLSPESERRDMGGIGADVRRERRSESEFHVSTLLDTPAAVTVSPGRDLHAAQASGRAHVQQTVLLGPRAALRGVRAAGNPRFRFACCVQGQARPLRRCIERKGPVGTLFIYAGPRRQLAIHPYAREKTTFAGPVVRAAVASSP